MQINIRKASPQDIPQVLQLITELAVFEKEPDAVEVTEKDLLQYGFGDTPMFQCFIAEVANEVVGMALLYFRFSTWKGPVVHLEDLVVNESMRSKGVGEALYHKVMQFAHQKGVKRVQWEVLGWNEGAIKFYEKSGAHVLRDWHVVHMDETGLHHYINKKSK